jgi:hypothetical protein
MDHLMVHGLQRSSLLLFTSLLIQGMREVLTHKCISRLVARVVVFDYKQNKRVKLPLNIYHKEEASLEHVKKG